jgi:uncharacterized membrane protein
MLKETSSRIQSVDLLRGIVMIVMVLDHARTYFHADSFLYDPLDLNKTNGVLFFTRWITHYCAPVFVFLAGTSAFLSGNKKNKAELSRYLLTRGLWLVLLEISVVNFGWFFNPFLSFTILQVIWAIGVSMIVLSLLVKLPLRFILIIGVAVVFGHNSLDGFHPTGTSLGTIVWSLLHEPQVIHFDNGLTIFILYPLLPWIGTMALGYCFGSLYTNYDSTQRKQMLIYIGSTAVALFLTLRIFNLYGDPSPWSTQSTPLLTLLSFLNTSKYPPSLLYLLMTLGPAILFLAFTEGESSSVSKKVIVFGRVPMFYYLMHVYVLHILAVVVALISGYPPSSMVFTSWIATATELTGYGFGLWFVYVVWIGVVILLYPLCKAFENYKRCNRQQVWLSYL